MAWEQLIGFVQEAAEIERVAETTPPTSCPNDYTALREAPGGKLYCPWDGLVWPDDAAAWGKYPGEF